MIETTYTIAADGKSITCELCGLTSHNRNDVREKFCSRCKVFHDEPGAQRLREEIRASIRTRLQEALP